MLIIEIQSFTTSSHCGFTTIHTLQWFAQSSVSVAIDFIVHASNSVTDITNEFVSFAPYLTNFFNARADVPKGFSRSSG